MHTPLCGHAYGDPIEYVEAAADAGLSLVTFTCHIPMRDKQFAQQGIRMSLSEIPAYKQMIAEARQHGKLLGIEVLTGIEAEVHPDRDAMTDMQQLLETEAFDFVLGSLHHQLPAFRNWLLANNHLSDREIITAYFDCLAMGASSGIYHSLSHPDVIRMYGTLQGKFDPAEHEVAIKRFLDQVSDSGTCLEVNTSGLIKGDFIAHPDPVIMDWAIEREIPFTIGSDAHAPHMVGQYFEQVIDDLKNRGLQVLHYYKAGKRFAVKL